MSDVIRILIAPLIWLACFSAIYGLHGLSCSSSLGPTLSAGFWQAALIAAWVGALGLQVMILVIVRRRPAASPLVARVSGLLVWTSLAATVWSLFPVAVLSGGA